MLVIVYLIWGFYFLIPVIDEYNKEIRRGLFLLGVRPSAYWLRFSINAAVVLFYGGY
eukprot:Pgem_evm1s14804